MRTLLTDYQSHECAIRHIRDQVFVVEQAVSREEEFDDRDPLCTHALVYSSDLAVATGRIDLERGGKVGRVAVLASYRRQGVGTLVMQALEQHALIQGHSRIWFHAQTRATAFYQVLGYRPCSEEFMEANIPHVRMEKML